MYHHLSLIGVKGRLQSSKYEDENKKVHYITDVIAERVTFLSTNKKHEVVNDDDANFTNIFTETIYTNIITFI